MDAAPTPTEDHAMTLNELIERLEKLEGPDREVDVEILTSFLGYRDVMSDGTYFARDNYGYWTLEGDENNRRLPSPTASLDEALTLVPDGYRWGCSQRQEGTAPLPQKFHGWVMPINSCLADDECEGRSDATPAIALCIAALKARATTDEVKP